MKDLDTNDVMFLDEFTNDKKTILKPHLRYKSFLGHYKKIKQKPISTSVIEYKEIEEPCVSLTIIGENRLSDAVVFVKRGFRYTVKTIFSAIVLTILNLFI